MKLDTSGLESTAPLFRSLSSGIHDEISAAPSFAHPNSIIFDGFQKEAIQMRVSWLLLILELAWEAISDESGTAAIKTVELDAVLGGRTVQHRELQGYESDKFLSYFKPCIIPLEGGVASGFKTPEEEVFETRLYVCRGKRVVRMKQVPFARSSLNHDDVFILDTQNKIYQFNGANSNIQERAKALEVIQFLKGKYHDGTCDVAIVDDGKLDTESDSGEFWVLFGGFAPIGKQVTSEDDIIPEATPAKLYSIGRKRSQVDFKCLSGSFKKSNFVCIYDLLGVDMFGERVGFLKFKADIVDKETGKKVPGIVFARGPAVAILILLESEGETYTVLTEQVRVPVGRHILELPAGMLDDDKGDFVGTAAREVEEETGIQLNLEDMIDLTAFLEPSTGCRVFPSPGGCDEEISLFLYRGHVDKEIITQLQGKETGLRDHGELIKVHVVPYKNLWRMTADSKVLTAIALYEMAMREGLLLQSKT
ncbi:hypothetical protein CMV_010914 [Castanea mollissima]|uniref:Nudix hydrolase domain-containing protein n=1 Tax=Castanea mollissima TaxID=60419 RepID=A0A8J4RIG6_9ROSI|nr:hypothetical protein CMV_010914 [Castanea mollissima]